MNQKRMDGFQLRVLNSHSRGDRFDGRTQQLSRTLFALVHSTGRRRYAQVSDSGPGQMLETILASHSPRCLIALSFQSVT